MRFEHAWSRPAEILAFVAVLAASAALHLAAVQNGGQNQSNWRVTAAWALGALVAYLWLTRPRAPRLRPVAVNAVLLLALAASISSQRVDVDLLKLGAPLVLLMLTALRDMALAAAALGRSPSAQRVAVSSSLSVAMVAFSLGSGGRLFCLMLVCLVAAAGWLMAGAWLEAQGRAAPSTRSTLPWFPLAAGCGGTILVVLAATMMYPDELSSLETVALSWHKYVPKSLNALHRTRMLRSQSEALSDLSALKYGAAEGIGMQGGEGSLHAGRGSMERSLAAELRGAFVSDGGHRSAERFSIVRRGALAQAQDLLLQRALFQTSRQLPLHLPVTSYDRFDGVQWRPEYSFFGPRKAAQILDGKGQTTVFQEIPFSLDPRRIADAEAEAEAAKAAAAGDVIDRARIEAARILALWTGGGRVVEPEVGQIDPQRLSQLLAVSPDKEKAEPQYLMTQYDLAKLTEQLQRDPALLARFKQAFTSDEHDARDVLREYLRWRSEEGSTLLPPEAQKLLAAWTAGKQPGWEQVEAVIVGLRHHGVHDPEAMIPQHVFDPTMHFLLRSRRGPDYLFASTAVILLRSLGHPSRMVGGFYARPEKRSFWTRRSSVHADDVHYWVQTRLPDRTWVDLEPTPGYEMPEPELSWPEWGARVGRRMRDWGRNHQDLMLAAGIAMIVAFALRRRILDRLTTLVWHARLYGNANRAVLATWRLIERRARRAGRTRPPGQTLQVWTAELFPHRPEAAGQLVELADLADRAVHAPGGLDACRRGDQADVRALCRRAAASCSIALLRTPAPAHRARSARASYPTQPTRGLHDDSHQNALLLRLRRRRSPHRFAAWRP